MVTATARSTTKTERKQGPQAQDAAAPPSAVYLYGTGRMSEKIADFLDRTNVDIAGLITDPEDAPAPWSRLLPRFRNKLARVRTLSMTEYQAEAESAADTPIVLADVEQDGERDRFLKTLAAANEFAGAETPLLHPSALVPLCKPAGICALLGYPGSGNRVTQAVLSHIYRTHLGAQQRLDADQRLMTKLVQRHTESLKQYLGDRLADLGELKLRVTRGKTQTTQAVRISIDGGDYVFVKGVRSQAHFSHFFAGHLQPREELLSFLEQRGHRVFFIQRHPLDVIVSCAAKTVRPPQLVIDKDDWFDRIADNLEQVLRRTHENRHRMHVIRYEELISQPVPTIQSIARTLDIDLGEPAAQAIWDKYGFKSVTPAGGAHLWRPGSGKYREYLRKEHWQKLVDAGVLEAARLNGYDFSADDFSDRAPINPNEVQPDSDQSGVDDKFFGKVDRTKAHVAKIPKTKLRIMSNREDLANDVAERLNNDVFLRLDRSTVLADR